MDPLESTGPDGTVIFDVMSFAEAHEQGLA